MENIWAPKMAVSSSIILFVLTLVDLLLGEVSGLFCKACEGDTCMMHQMSVNCEFPARQCMRLTARDGRVLKMGCLYPYDQNCQYQMGDQVRCYTCEYDNCNAVQNPYGGPDYGGGGYPGQYPDSGYGGYGRGDRYGPSRFPPPGYPNGPYRYWNSATVTGYRIPMLLGILCVLVISLFIL